MIEKEKNKINLKSGEIRERRGYTSRCCKSLNFVCVNGLEVMDEDVNISFVR